MLEFERATSNYFIASDYWPAFHLVPQQEGPKYFRQLQTVADIVRRNEKHAFSSQAKYLVRRGSF